MSFDALRSGALTVLAGIAAEFIATFYVWFVIPSSGEVSRAWYTGKFADYFTTRITIWGALATVAAILYLILHFRRWALLFKLSRHYRCGACGNRLR
jgi:hypothetical protein